MRERCEQLRICERLCERLRIFPTCKTHGLCGLRHPRVCAADCLRDGFSFPIPGARLLRVRAWRLRGRDRAPMLFLQKPEKAQRRPPMRERYGAYRNREGDLLLRGDE